LKIVRDLFGFLAGLVIGDVLLDNDGMLDVDERGQWRGVIDLFVMIYTRKDENASLYLHSNIFYFVLSREDELAL
jgi:hypothetical protein